MSLKRRFASGILGRFLARLRFPRLFLLTAVFFAADLALPDAIPLADEILLGLGTALLGAWRRERRGEDAEESSEDGSEGGR